MTSLRSNYRIPVYREATDGVEPWLNLSEAAAIVGVAPRTLRLAVERGEVDARHPLEDGPWIFSRAEIEGPTARGLAARAKGNPKYPAVSDPTQKNLFPSMT